MTVKELYNWAKNNHCLDYDIKIPYSSPISILFEEDIEINRQTEEIEL